MTRTYMIADEAGYPNDPDGYQRRMLVTWEQLATDNDADTMDEIDRLEIGQRTTLGMSDDIERVS